MKATTRIRMAVKLAREAYCRYSRIVLKHHVKARTAEVRFMPGQGWRVDGKLFRKMTADEVIDYYDELQRGYHQSVIDFRTLQQPTLFDDLNAASDTDVVNSTTK